MSLAHAKTSSVYVEPNVELESNLQEKREPGRGRRRKVDPAVVITVLAVLVLAAALLQVGQRARLATLTYELHNARSRLMQLERVQTQLLVEMEAARALTRIDVDARNRLGMVRPDSTEWLFLPSESAPAAVSEPKSGWIEAVSAWYERLSSSIRAALPMQLGGNVR